MPDVKAREPGAFWLIDRLAGMVSRTAGTRTVVGVDATALADSRGKPFSLPGTGWDHFRGAHSQQ